MRAWIVRSLRAEGYERMAFDRGLIAVGWSPVGDLASRTEEPQIRDAVRAAYPFAEGASAANYTRQLHLFRTEMAAGDLVLLPSRSGPDVAAGRVTGDYRYRTDLGGEVRHTRPVQWARTDLARADIERELPSLSPLVMVHRIDHADTISRLLAMVDSGRPPLADDQIPAWRELPEESAPFANFRRNLGYARRLATAGQHLGRLKVGAFEVSDVYRAAWVQSVAALDHWVREEVRARMRRLASPLGGSKPKGFSMFSIPLGQVEQILQSQTDLVDVVDQQLTRVRGHMSYQSPANIREAFRLVSDVEDLWAKAASVLTDRAADGTSVTGQQVKDRLTEVVRRRNKIAHESDMDPDKPSTRCAIDAAHITQTIDWIEQTAAAILEVLDTNWK
jgi:hypothetical protein